MAAQAETVQNPEEPTKSATEGNKTDEKTETSGIKRVFADAREQLDKLWNDTFGELNTRLQTTEGELKEFVKRLETEGRERLTKVLELLKLDKWTTASAKDLFSNPTKLRDEIVEQGQVFAQGSADALGLVTEAQLKALTAEVAKLSNKLDKLDKAANGAAKKSVNDLAKRVKTLEDGLKPAKKTSAKKTSAKKTSAKK